MLQDSVGSSLLLIFVLALILVAAYFTTKFLSVKGGNLMKGRYMQVKDRLILAKDKQILLVEVSGRFYIVGISGQQIQVLGALENGELTPLPQEPPRVAASAFGDMLAKLLKKEGNNDKQP